MVTDPYVDLSAEPNRQNFRQDGMYGRRLPVGAELHDGVAHFRIWAPKRAKIDVVFESNGSGRILQLGKEHQGYFSGRTSVQAGERYWFRLDGNGPLLPDPASRFQPDGPHGPSELIDPTSFTWTDRTWTGPALDPAIIYEMHVGTFTPEGTWQSALPHLAALHDLGITVLEIMPVAEFPGRFGWGYDGVDLFAPTHLYGRPDDFRRFVDTAHGLGLGVILDVVYNHLGPDGNYLAQFTDTFFTDRYVCEWGDAVNFDGEGCEGTREFILANASYWIDEFHLDGLRIDATQQIFDNSSVHILAELGQVTREAATRQRRRIYIVCENEAQDTKLVCPLDQGGYELDALWNDDFHHAAVVAATGQRRAYFSDYRGAPQEFVATAKFGFLYQGQHYKWQGKRRGTPTFGLAPHRFVNYLQNHDQVANTGTGKRLHQLTSFGRYKALTALTILMPGAPMLMQGQEFTASTPFTFFADHKSELTDVVRHGRNEFLTQFDNLASADMTGQLPDPSSYENFRACVLDHAEREYGQHAQALALHRDLIHLRKTDLVLRAPARRDIDGAVLGNAAFLLRWFGETHRLLLINLDQDLRLESAPEPLLAPPSDAHWELLWSSEHPDYGGQGTPEIETKAYWYLPGRAAVLLSSVGGEPRSG